MAKKEVPGGVLAEGEITNHAHRVAVPVYETELGREFAGPAEVVHEEHGPIVLPKKAMVSGRVREMDHYAKEARQVMD